MLFEELKKIDQSLDVISGDVTAFEITSISHSDAPVEKTFVFVKSMKFLNEIGRRSDQKVFKNSGVVVEKKFVDKLAQEKKTQLFEMFSWVATTESVGKSMCLLSKPFYDKKYKNLNYQVDGREMGDAQIDPTSRISQNVFIGSEVKVGKNTVIMPGCVILPNTIIGDDCTIYPNVTIYPFCEIGNNCRIHAGTMIGTDGFGYNFFDGEHHKIWHLNGVVIGDNVEIGCSAMLDCGAFISTKIGNGTKIDNNVQISHNVQVGNHVVLCGTSGLAGSAEVDDYCVFAGHAGVAPGARLGKGVQVGAFSLVSENAIVKDGETLAGYPARPIKEWLKAQALIRKLIKK